MKAEAGKKNGLALRAATIIVAIALLRVLALHANGTDLFFDESQYWSWSEAPAFGYYSKPPLIAWIIAASTALCGDSAFCIRLPAPLIHAATAFLVFLLARRLYDERVGLWSATAYATLPGVSVSSGIISTDVPLLFAWTLGLIAVASLIKAPSWRAALLLGAALGLGLNAKYAMAYFLLCTLVYLWLEPTARWLARSPKLWAAFGIGAAMIAPNLVWNAANSFATFAHTADNAKWEGSLVHPLKALEFFAAQFGVFGPILFGTLLAFVWRAAKGRLTPTSDDKLLLAYSLPVIAVVLGQAFLSRAHPNWAAVAYVPAVVLVTAYMLREREWSWLKGSLWLNGAAAAVIALATWQAGQFALPGGTDPFARTLGNRAMAEEVVRTVAEARARGRPFAAILSDERELTASLLYYARVETTPVYAWRTGPRPHDHFELSRPFPASMTGPVLLISRKPDPSGVTGAFTSAEDLGQRRVKAGNYSERTFHLFSLTGYRSP